LDRKFEEISAEIKCIVIEQTKEIIHLKSLLTAQIDHKPKLQENLWTEKTIIPTSTLNEKNAVARTPLANLSESKTTDPLNNTFNPKENHAHAKTCGHCQSPANLSCSKCQMFYYWTSKHQIIRFRYLKCLLIDA
jgi:hypothetical protein